MTGEKVKATAWGFTATVGLALLILLGSRRLADFDAALVGYTFATLFATFGIIYRYSMWLQRPPTAMFWKRGWQLFFAPRYLLANLLQLGYRLGVMFALNRFIWRRSIERGAAHFLLMWGCIIAVAITFPLVFGWIHFQTLPDDLSWYRVYVPKMAEGKLHCPCHHGYFDLATGRPLAGPPRRPLPRVLLRVRRGIVEAYGVERGTT